MKSYTTYICETCGKESKDAEEIRVCEDAHLGLTPDEALRYEALEEIILRRSHTVSVTNNETTRMEYDKAIVDIIAFEKEHNIKNQ